MKNEFSWKPSKYIVERDKLRASRDRSEVNTGSRMIVEIIAGFYDKAITEYTKGRLLDLGCGKAPLFIKYKSYVSSVTLVDWSNTPHKNNHLDFECDLSKALPFNDDSFDTIILSDVLEHLPDPDLLWKEMSRILSVGGYILMNVPYFYPLHELPYDYYRYSSSALKRFAELNGFRVIQLDAIGGSPEVFSDMISKHLIFVPVFGKLAALLVQSITLVFIRSKVGRKLSIKTSERYPLGYFMIARKD